MTRVIKLLAKILVAAVAAAALSAEGQTPALQITNLSVGPQGPLLSWQDTGINSAYTVQFQDSLQDGIWRVPFQPFPVAARQFLDEGQTNGMRFYRAVGVSAAQRGKVLSVVPSGSYSTFILNFMFASAGLPLTAQYGVDLYKVTYETITPLGARTMASGALVLPQNPGKLVPLLSYQHGTILQTNAAPSSMGVDTEAGIGIAFASAGYAAAVPDYLGLGDSPGLHPYHHARSEATACIDMLRAVKTICSTNGVLNGQLFLCGYSQGGHATMALFRELETFYTNEFTVTACAPMAGAYDLSGVTASDFLSGRIEPNPYYFLYLLAGYQEVYHFAPALSDLLSPPFNSTLPPLIYGNADGAQINAAMTNPPAQILKSEYLAAFQSNPRHPLRLALQDNDLYRWRPRAPVQLFHCSGDQDVLPVNSQVAYTNFLALGCQVQLTDPQPGADHGGCVYPSLLKAKAWFDGMRQN